MLDRLPPELLAHVLSFVNLPTQFFILYYRLTLYNCCLVSKYVKQVAQPLLWSAISSRRLDTLAKQARYTRFGRHVRTMALEGSEDFSRLDVVTLLKLPKVDDVRLMDFCRTGLDGNAFLPFLVGLRTLTLLNVSFAWGPAQPVAFPHLVSLYLHFCWSLPSALEALFQQRYFPSLRRLYISRMPNQRTYFGHIHLGNTYFPSIDPALLDQLEFLHTDDSNLPDLPRTVFSHSVSLLVTITWDAQEHEVESVERYPFIRHLHLAVGAGSPQHLDPRRGDTQVGTLQVDPENEQLRLNLKALADVLEALPLLKVLILPNLARLPYFFKWRKALKKKCKEMGVELLWEEVGSVEDFGLVWPRNEFREWLEEEAWEDE